MVDSRRADQNVGTPLFAQVALLHCRSQGVSGQLAVTGAASVPQELARQRTSVPNRTRIGGFAG